MSLTLTNWTIQDPNNSIADRTPLNTVYGDKYLAIGDFKELIAEYEIDSPLSQAIGLTIEFNPNLYGDKDTLPVWWAGGGKDNPLNTCKTYQPSAYVLTLTPSQAIAAIGNWVSMSPVNVNTTEEHFPFMDVQFQIDTAPNTRKYYIKYPFFVTGSTRNSFIRNYEYANWFRLAYAAISGSIIGGPFFQNTSYANHMYTDGAYINLASRAEVETAGRMGLRLTNQTDITTNDTLLIESLDGSDFVTDGWVIGDVIQVEYYTRPDAEEARRFKSVITIENVTSSTITGKFDVGYTNQVESIYDGKEFVGFIVSDSKDEIQYGQFKLTGNCSISSIPAAGYFWNEGVATTDSVEFINTSGVSVSGLSTTEAITVKFRVNTGGLKPTQCKFWVMQQGDENGAISTPGQYWKDTYRNEPINWLYGSVPVSLGANIYESELVVDPAIYTLFTNVNYAIGTVWYFENDDVVSPNLVFDIPTEPDEPTGDCVPPITGDLATYTEIFGNYIQASPLQRLRSTITLHLDVYEACRGAIDDTTFIQFICRIKDVVSGTVYAQYTATRIAYDNYNTSSTDFTVSEIGTAIRPKLIFRLLDAWTDSEIELEWEFITDVEYTNTFFYQRVLIDKYQEDMASPSLIETNLYDVNTLLPLGDTICPDDPSYNGFIVETVRDGSAPFYKQVAMWYDGNYQEHDPFLSSTGIPAITDASEYNVDTYFTDTNTDTEVQWYADPVIQTGRVGMIGYPDAPTGEKNRVFVHHRLPKSTSVVFQSPQDMLPNNRVLLTDTNSNDSEYNFRINTVGDIYDPSWLSVPVYDITTIQTQTITSSDFVMITYNGSSTNTDLVSVFEFRVANVVPLSTVIPLTHNAKTAVWDIMCLPFEDITFDAFPSIGSSFPWYESRNIIEMQNSTELTDFVFNNINILNFSGSSIHTAHLVNSNSTALPLNTTLKVTGSTVPYVDIACDLKNDFAPYNSNPACFEIGLGDFISTPTSNTSEFLFDIEAMAVGQILAMSATVVFQAGKPFNEQVIVHHTGDTSNSYTQFMKRGNLLGVVGYSNFTQITGSTSLFFDTTDIGLVPNQAYTIVMYVTKETDFGGGSYQLTGRCWVNGLEIPIGQQDGSITGSTASNKSDGRIVYGGMSPSAKGYNAVKRVQKIYNISLFNSIPSELNVRRYANGDILAFPGNYRYVFDTLVNTNQFNPTGGLPILATIENNVSPTLSNLF